MGRITPLRLPQTLPPTTPVTVASRYARGTDWPDIKCLTVPISFKEHLRGSRLGAGLALYRDSAVRIMIVSLEEGRGRMGGAPVKACDICNVSLRPADGYYLPTRSIVASELFWRYQYTQTKALVDDLEFDERQLLNVFSGAVSRAAGSRTPWLVCGKCSEFFVFDRDKARSCAITDSEPERNGPVEPGACALFAAAAWEHLYGRWPATVEQPSVGDSCDLCAKKIYRGEMAGSIDGPRMEGLRATGVIKDPPLSPPRADSGAWVICAPCTIRIMNAVAIAGRNRPEQ
jgi:hypothetical protein